MKSVLISIQPSGCHKIIDGDKTIEVRKTKPKLDTPFKAYIYCSAGSYEWRRDIWATAYFPPSGECTNMSQMVIGEFACDRIDPIKAVRRDGGSAERSWKSIFTFMPSKRHNALLNATGMETEEIYDYLGGEGKWGYAWHISDLKIYDKPKELSEFWRAGKCPYASENGCTYESHCFRSGQMERCGETLNRPPKSWCYVEDPDGLRENDG